MSIFPGIGVSATSLRVQQKAIDVLSQNISNVNTPGYSRQKIQLVSAAPERINGVNFGRGVAVGNIVRTVDEALIRAELVNSGKTALAQTLQQGLSSVESAFGNLSAPGISSVLDSFFTSLQDLANAPSDNIVRLDVRGRAQDMTRQIVDMRQQLSDRQQSADLEIDPIITKVNTTVDQIASLNGRILSQETGSSAFQANDLRDQRDLKVNELAQLMDIRKIPTQDGSLLIQTPGGDLLVQRDISRHVQRVIGAGSFKDIVFADNKLKAAGIDKGGQIGGIITLRDTNLNKYISDLDSLAKNIIFSINQEHATGVGSTLVSSYTSSRAANNPAGAVNADVGLPFASQIKDGAFTIRILDSTGNQLNPALSGTVNITAASTTLDGGAGSVVDQINKLASLGTGGTPAGTVTASLVNNKLKITDSNTNNRIVFESDTSNFLAAYEMNTFFTGTQASDMAVDSSIVADAGRIGTGAVDAAASVGKLAVAAADNTVALNLLALRDKAVNIDGSTPASLVDRAGTLASTFGLDLAAAQSEVTFRETEANSLSKQRQSVSGVNVDEELVTMLNFQRAYEASAKILQTSNQMLSALLGLIR